MKHQALPEKYRLWVEARKRFKLSHAQIQKEDQRAHKRARAEPGAPDA